MHQCSVESPFNIFLISISWYDFRCSVIGMTWTNYAVKLADILLEGWILTYFTIYPSYHQTISSLSLMLFIISCLENYLRYNKKKNSPGVQHEGKQYHTLTMPFVKTI